MTQWLSLAKGGTVCMDSFSHSILSLRGTCEIASMVDLGGHQRLSSASFSVNATFVYVSLIFLFFIFLFTFISLLLKSCVPGHLSYKLGWKRT
jgi:hypothetical protein